MSFAKVEGVNVRSDKVGHLVVTAELSKSAMVKYNNDRSYVFEGTELALIAGDFGMIPVKQYKKKCIAIVPVEELFNVYHNQ